MTWKPHVTVAAIAQKKGKFLMVEEYIDGKIVYNQPAGHLEPGETLIQAVVRVDIRRTAGVDRERLCYGKRGGSQDPPSNAAGRAA